MHNLWLNCDNNENKNSNIAWFANLTKDKIIQSNIFSSTNPFIHVGWLLFNKEERKLFFQCVGNV